MPLPLPEDLLVFVDNLVMLSRHEVESRVPPFKNGSRQVGFTGQATFTIARKNDGLRKYDKALAQTLEGRDDLARVLGMLADFAFYSGVGIKTSQGMGMVRMN